MKHLLLALALGMGTFSCSKLETAAPTPTAVTATTNIGSYKMDGRLVNCTVKANAYKASNGDDILILNLTTTPRPAAGEEVFVIECRKNKSQPVSAFSPYTEILFTDNQIIFFNLGNLLVSGTTGGGYSGTFATTSHNTSPTINITDGVFTDARP